MSSTTEPSTPEIPMLMKSPDRQMASKLAALVGRPIACVVPATLLILSLLLASGAGLAAPAEKKAKAGPPAASATKKADPAAAKAAAEKAKKRADAVARLADRLGLGKGGVVADIGAGGGADTWVFAEIVGPAGKVYAVEITEKQVKSLEGAARQRKLPQVSAVQGREDSPALPREAVDLAHMRLVYHHVSKPREMLAEIWRALKPGGHLVVVDQRRGTLRDWVPREVRKDKHFWIAETTVVREAREAGFAFVACAEDCCDMPEAFVLVFQRPRGVNEPGHEADRFLPLPLKDVAAQLLQPGVRYQRPALVALGQARELIRPVLERSAGQGIEIVLEEWATEKSERAPLPSGVQLPSVLTDQGDPRLGPEPIDAVFFLDSYHLLFHQKTLLAKLKEKLTPGGCIYVLDREAKEDLSRREASHRRRIAPETVKQEMAAAGFVLRSEHPRPAPDRFLLVFGRQPRADER
jgi:predicted methyltransferase